jgi:osmoprotectant transport system substrate-binding protein
MDAIYDIVAAEYQSQFNLVWLQPWGFNNTYVLAIRQDTADQLGITKTSELVGQEGDLTFGATQEFLIRPDGLPGLEAAYGLDFSDEVGLDPGLVYSALDEGDVDIISAFATDGRIPQLGLVTLEDDLGFFPPYFAAPVVRQELLDESPEVADVLNVMAGRIDNATMANLNAEVDVNGVEAIEVARGYLQAQDLLSEEAE